MAALVGRMTNELIKHTPFIGTDHTFRVGESLAARARISPVQTLDDTKVHTDTTRGRLVLRGDACTLLGKRNELLIPVGPLNGEGEAGNLPALLQLSQEEGIGSAKRPRRASRRRWEKVCCLHIGTASRLIATRRNQ